MPRGRPRTNVDPCSFCQKQFSRMEHLKRHERTHTREKPYQCSLCTQRFTRRDLLTRHEKLIHTQRVDKDCANETVTNQDHVDNVSTSNFEHSLSTSSGAAAISNIPSSETSETRMTLTTADTSIIESNVDSLEEAAITAVGAPGPPKPQQPELDATLADHAIFADMDGLDWLWRNELFNSFSPTALFEATSLVNEEGEATGISPQLARIDKQGDTETNTMAFGQGLNGVSSATEQPSPVYHDSMSLMNSPMPRPEMLTAPPITLDEPWDVVRGLKARGDKGIICPWRVSLPKYEAVCASIASLQMALPFNFAMPSRHTFSRYTEGYFRGFHEHLPLLHVPTFSLVETPPELILAIVAVGALYKFEHERGYELYFAARAALRHRLNNAGTERRTSIPRHSWSSSRGSKSQPGLLDTRPNDMQSSRALFSEIQTLQAVNILMAMASWGEGAIVGDGLEMATHAASLARRINITSSDKMSPDVRWKSWVVREQHRRTILVTYTILNLQSVAFNVPPLIMSQEVGLCLPHPTAMWRATTEAEWLQASRSSSHGERQFRTVLSDLLCGREVANPAQISSFGNYVLIHGLVQQIYIERQAYSLKGSFASLTTETVQSLVNSLQSWQRCWENSDESTLDPLSPKGPLAFNSTALLRVAYIRLNADLGPYRAVQIRDPLSLARSVSNAPSDMLQRDMFTDVAVLQCIHALGIIVQAGVPFVSRTHTQSWSIVHSLGHIECACFLSLWLRNIAMSVESQGPSSIREAERKLLGMITSVVEEWTPLDEPDHERNGLLRIKQLIVSTARIWAGALEGEHVFQMVETIAQGLSIVASMFS